MAQTPEILALRNDFPSFVEAKFVAVPVDVTVIIKFLSAGTRQTVICDKVVSGYIYGSTLIESGTRSPGNWNLLSQLLGNPSNIALF